MPRKPGENLLGPGRIGRGRLKGDVFDTLGWGRREVVGEGYKSLGMVWEYMSSMGRIKGGRDTGLRNVNQRRMAKAVRRCVGLGLHPSVHKHPELLEREAEAKALNKRPRRS